MSIDSCTEINDSIQFKSQVNSYSITADYSGTYYFGLKNVLEGYTYKISVYNSAEKHIDYGTYTNGNGLSVALTAGQTYFVDVGYTQYTGSYTLYIGKPKPSVDISEYTLVNDSIEFKKQRNYYTFTPKRNGTYYFGFTNIPEGYKYEVNVYNPGGENLTFGNLYRTYATLSLTNGQPYTIVVSDYGYHGDYSLIVGKQKETLDISNYDVVKDSFQFPCQWNVYLFTPDTDGRYSFTVNNDYGFVRAYNPGGSLLSPFGAIDLALTAGQTYTIKVEHNEYKGYFGNYNLNISRE